MYLYELISLFLLFNATIFLYNIYIILTNLVYQNYFIHILTTINKQNISGTIILKDYDFDMKSVQLLKTLTIIQDRIIEIELIGTNIFMSWKRK